MGLRLVALTLAALLAACYAGPENGRSSATANPESFLAAPSAERAQAAILDGKGSPIGTAAAFEDRVGVRVDVKVTALSEGLHGVHVHAVGKCEGAAFTTAGGHFNPAGKKHGHLVADGPHAGDLGNLEVGKDGTGSASFYTPLLSTGPGNPNSVLLSGGLAIVVHAGPDDEKTDPSGNSGDRVGCGVFKRVPTS
jgi:Cu-Zn family superoxide dismutase